MHGTTSMTKVLGWEYSFHAGVPCLFCGNDERVVLVPASDVAVPEEVSPAFPVAMTTLSRGVCEACASHLTWIWRQSPPDASLASDSVEATRIKVLVARLRPVVEGEAIPDQPHSYDFAMAAQPDGGVDFPTAELAKGEAEFAAVSRALAQVGLATWTCCCESLYEGHTPRGRVARLVLVTACAKISELKIDPQWREWPPWEHATGMGGLYRALQHVWPLRIWKHLAREPRTSGITTVLREGAAKYVQIQRDLRSGVSGVDTSMLEYLRKSMTDDEKLVDRVLRDYEQKEAEVRAERGEGEREELPNSTEAGVFEEMVGEDPEMFEDGDDESVDS
jgi:hypothetical protein